MFVFGLLYFSSVSFCECDLISSNLGPILNKTLLKLPDSKYSNIVLVSSSSDSDLQFSELNEIVQQLGLSSMTSFLFTR